MMAINPKEKIKKVVGQIPYAAELYWLVIQQGKTLDSRFSLKNLEGKSKELVEAANAARIKQLEGKDIFIFATLHYWIEHAALLGTVLAGMGNRITLGYLPYSDWQSPINKFDLNRQNAYASKVLSGLSPLMRSVSFLAGNRRKINLPKPVSDTIEQVTRYDTQYTLQIEEVDTQNKIYQMRLKRNTIAANAAYRWLYAKRPEVVIVPNGTIQEFGVVYQIAMLLDIPVVTYEFDNQRDRIWLAQNSETMQQDTDRLWEAFKNKPITKSELERVKDLYQSRKQATLWENFSRLWQETPSSGGQKVCLELGLDDRPIVLLPTNVLGDSLTLGRELFSQSMAEWISRTVQYFSGRDDVQFIIRVHPGEVLTHGLSMLDVVHDVLPQLPENIYLIEPDDKINTYDLVEIADVGLVYTTTVGLEMAMSGLPVIVAGKTHYRGRGFTQDPDSWVSYYKTIGQILCDPIKYRLKKEQIDLAWNYAYRFFFDFPRPYPWHLVKLWDDYKANPLSDVLSTGGMKKYKKTFEYLSGEPIDWQNISRR